MKKFISTCLLMGLITLSACSNDEPLEVELPEPARPAKISIVSEHGASLYRTYPGVLDSANKADLAFRVSGQLIELPAKAGLPVKKGDLLAKLDPKDFVNILEERKAMYQLAKTQLEQAKKLAARNLSSKIDLDKATANIRTASSALEIAKNNLEYSSLKAPFDGVVAKVNIENHQSVTKQMPIILLRDDQQLEIKFSIPETTLSKLKQRSDPVDVSGFCGVVSLAANPETKINACHREHETEPDQLTRTYTAYFRLDSFDDFFLLPGMTATISLDFTQFLAKRSESSVFAPVEAVFSEQDKQYVWVVKEDMTATKRQVEVGLLEGSDLEITTGLVSGDKVIVAGVSYIREGMKIKPIVKQRGI